MKITLIRKDEEQGTEALSLCDTDAFFEKVKTENKAGHISELREILPRLAGSSARYVHIDKLPRRQKEARPSIDFPDLPASSYSPTIW